MSAVSVWLSLLVTNSARFFLTRKKKRWIDVRGLRLAFVGGHKLGQIFRLEGFPARLHELEGCVRECFHSHHRHFLKKSAAVPRRLQPIRRKLFPDVIRRDVAAALPRPPSFQFIARKIFHMSANFLLVYLWQWRLRHRRLLRLPCCENRSRKRAHEHEQGARTNQGTFLHGDSSTRKE